jgi:hypothetical protein
MVDAEVVGKRKIRKVESATPGNVTTWAQVDGCCGKWRVIDESDRLAVKLVKDLKCIDVGTSCDVPQDEKVESEQCVDDDEEVHEVQMFQALKKSVQWSEELWVPGEAKHGTYGEKARAAAKKESDAFNLMKMFRYDPVFFECDLNDSDIIVDYNGVWGEKGVELKCKDPLNPERRIKLRIVAWRERRKGSLKKIWGVAENEIIASFSPSMGVIRLCVAWGAICGQKQELSDMLNGFFQSRKGDAVRVFANLPDELWPEEWNQKYDHCRKDIRCRPLCELDGGQYGRKRANCDFDNFTVDALSKCSFIRNLDIDACVHTRVVDDEKVVDAILQHEKKRGVVRPDGLAPRHVPPDALCRYVDDLASNIWDCLDV